MLDVINDMVVVAVVAVDANVASGTALLMLTVLLLCWWY